LIYTQYIFWMLNHIFELIMLFLSFKPMALIAPIAIVAQKATNVNKTESNFIVNERVNYKVDTVTTK